MVFVVPPLQTYGNHLKVHPNNDVVPTDGISEEEKQYICVRTLNSRSPPTGGELPIVRDFQRTLPDNRKNRPGTVFFPQAVLHAIVRRQRRNHGTNPSTAVRYPLETPLLPPCALPGPSKACSKVLQPIKMTCR
ncbi:hypothetical protein PoB_005507900 [Plakobranchus ocellatus]|uniref:Uncharacterized protein n=1 Tax=Plakobranchus ocellatus TaxID=259542 RepID=A0AAV4CCX7_9GAST|nr:hypothetical protein PoB_005507900 [Plakobranchus ocellatus]